MARTATLSVIRGECKDRADLRNSQFISDSEWNRYINQSYAELYDLLTNMYKDFYVSSTTVSLVAGTDTYNLPALFYKLLGVDLLINGVASSAITLRPFVFNERNMYTDRPSFTANGNNYRYRLLGSQIKLVPTPDTTDTLKLWYVPAITDLSSDGSTLDGVNGWEEYIVIDVAIKSLLKEESDVTALMMQKEAMKQRIREGAMARDTSFPDRVIDVNHIQDWNYWTSMQD